MMPPWSIDITLLEIAVSPMRNNAKLWKIVQVIALPATLKKDITINYRAPPVHSVLSLAAKPLAEAADAFLALMATNMWTVSA